ncbi:MAG: hypothetical protein HC845_15355 [Akkermansiaceae bacterium]|nr:hypothetical protein [Akkermansiaceae bacterium]
MILSAFTLEEFQKAKSLLAARVAYMMGRKLEEADWAHVYCKARGFDTLGWSNLNADVTVSGLSLEHKMMRCSESEAIKKHCGTRMMHPALTRRVSLPDIEDPDKAMRIVIASYQKVLDERFSKAAAISDGKPVELRSGWLLYDSSLTEFLYFEERSQNLNPKKHRAVWSERIKKGEGGRRGNRNLWVYDENDQKVWSVTGGSSGTKIQPYFKVPAANDKHLCYFRVQGEPLSAETVRVWITESTAKNLRQILGELDTRRVNDAILNVSASDETLSATDELEEIRDLVIGRNAYATLKEKFLGVSDEHCFQLLCKRLTEESASG